MSNMSEEGAFVIKNCIPYMEDESDMIEFDPGGKER